MTNEEMLARLDGGEMPCEMVDNTDDKGLFVRKRGLGDKAPLRPGELLIIIPPDTLRVAVGEDEFLQVFNGEVVAVWKQSEIYWVRPS